MSLPISEITKFLNKYVWGEPDSLPKREEEPPSSLEKRVEEANPLRKRADSKPDEPAWINPYKNGGCTE